MAWTKHNQSRRHPTEASYVPTPEQISQDAAVIRRGWSPATRRMRRVTSETAWHVPVVRTAELAAILSGEE